MTEEMHDIVDLNDNVIRVAPRSVVRACQHENPHRYINVLVCRSDGKIVLQQRSRHKPGPLLYDASVGGLVISGETYEQTAYRETEEELGFKPVELVRIAKFEDIKGGKFRGFGTLFTIIYDGELHPCEREVERLIEMKPEDILSASQLNPNDYTTGLKTAIKHYITWSQEQVGL